MANDSKLIAHSYSISLAAKEVGVSIRQLYYWEQLGIVKPIYEQFGSYQYRRYSQKDVELLIKLKQLLDEGYTLRAAASRVCGLENASDHETAQVIGGDLLHG